MADEQASAVDAPAPAAEPVPSPEETPSPSEVEFRSSLFQKGDKKTPQKESTKRVKRPQKELSVLGNPSIGALEQSRLLEELLVKMEPLKKKMAAVCQERRAAVARQQDRLFEETERLKECERKRDVVQTDLDIFNRIEFLSYKINLVNIKSLDISKSPRKVDKYRKEREKSAEQLQGLLEKLSPQATKNRYV